VTLKRCGLYAALRSMEALMDTLDHYEALKGILGGGKVRVAIATSINDISLHFC